MIMFLFAFVLGLFVGWFFLPTPAWARTVMTKIVNFVPGLEKFLKKD